MRMKQIVKYCREHGHPITSMAIYLAGKKYGFLKKVEGQYHLEFDKEKFLEWFKGFTAEVPEGYLSVKELSEEFKMSVPQCYALARDDSVKKVRKGTGDGVLYVDKKTFGEFVTVHKYGSDKDFI